MAQAKMDKAKLKLQARKYEQLGREALAEAKTDRVGGKYLSADLQDAAIQFSRAAEFYEMGGFVSKAESNYRLATRLEKSTRSPGYTRSEASAEKLQRWRMHIRNEPNTLEKATVVTSILGVLGGLFFLSTNITGNAIADMTPKTTSFLGAGLIIVGLVAGFFWMKSKKN